MTNDNAGYIAPTGKADYKVALNNVLVATFYTDGCHGSYHIVAADGNGRLYNHDHDFTTEALAATYLTKLLLACNRKPYTLLLNSDHWDYYRTTYGTLAWLADDCESLLMDDEERYRKGV